MLLYQGYCKIKIFLLNRRICQIYRYAKENIFVVDYQLVIFKANGMKIIISLANIKKFNWNQPGFQYPKKDVSLAIT